MSALLQTIISLQAAVMRSIMPIVHFHLRVFHTVKYVTKNACTQTSHTRPGKAALNILRTITDRSKWIRISILHNWSLRVWGLSVL